MTLDSALAVARLVSLIGRIEGRKRLQKLVYLLKSSGYKDFDQQFVLHYYGPFSRQLARELDFLHQANLVREIPPGEDENRSEGTYVYAPVLGGDKKPRIVELTGARRKPPWQEAAKLLADQSTPFLEALSTVVYLRRKGLTGEQLKEGFRRTKPKLGHHFSRADKEAGAYLVPASRRNRVSMPSRKNRGRAKSPLPHPLSRKKTSPR